MIEVLPVRDKSQQEAICFKCSINYNPDLMAYAAYSDGDVVGICQFSIKEDVARLIDLASVKLSNDDNILFVIARATFNFIDLCGVHIIKCDAKNIEKKLLDTIGFTENTPGNYEINLNNFF